MGEPKRSNVELLEEMSKLDYARLRLSFRDRQLHWEFRPSNRDTKKDYSEVGTEIHLRDRPLIELLSEVQQLLVDLRPDDGDQRDIVNGVLYRVAAELGDRLYAILFSDPVLKQKLEDALDKRNSGTHFVRIELEFSGASAFMAGWPWEYLCRLIQRDKPEGADFLALSTNLVLNRVLNFDFGKGFSTRSPSVLLVVSRPSDKGPVDCFDICTLVTKLKQDGVITLHDELIEPEWDEELVTNREPVVSWDAFSRSVKDNKPHVIHFIGHGRVVYKLETRKNVGQLAFVGKESGKAEWHDEEEVADLLTKSTSLRLVFLQACESGKTDPRAEGSGVARSIALRKVPAVVAMQAKVRNDVASKFACTLYNNLAAGLPIDWAVMKGREAVNALEKVPERKLSFGVPIVYLSSYLGLIDPNADANAQGGRSEIKTTGEGEFTCPACGLKLKREMNYCANMECGVQLRCLSEKPKLKPCTYPLDNPSVKGTRCGDCGQLVPPLAASSVSLPESAPAAPDSDGLSSEPTLLRDKLKERYPGPNFEPFRPS